MNQPCTNQELIAYHLVGGIADERQLIKDEADERLSQFLERKASGALDCDSDRLQHAAGFARLYFQSP